MSTKVLNIVRGAGVAVSVLALSSLSAQAQTVRVGVAANFAAPLLALVNDYNARIDPSATITITSKSTGVLKGEILSGGTSGPYDLFLAADQPAPVAVAAVSGLTINWPTGNAPFLYTTGEIVLWSDTVNISGGLPNPLTANVVIADPANAPYGFAGMQEINNVLSAGLTSTSSYPVTVGSYAVHTAANIDATYNAVAAHTYDYGFVAKSRVCQRVGGVETFTGVSHHVYPWNGSPGHNQLVQYGVGINISGRAPADTQALKDFIDYLLTDTTARSIIADFCYS
jgi:molybdate transport system substrate-binding protein